MQQEIQFNASGQFKKSALIVFLSLISLTAFAQTEKSIEEQKLVWWETIVQYKLNDSFQIYGEFGQRHLNGTEDLSQRIYRAGLSYSNANLPKITVGMARFEHDLIAGSSFLARPEWRSFLLVEVAKKFNHVQTDFRLRIEQRWNHKTQGDVLINGFDYNNRLGYRLRARIPLNKPEMQAGTTYFEATNEVLVNYGDTIQFNPHDQTRYSAAFGYLWNANVSSQLTYLYLYQQKSNGTSFLEQHILRVNLSLSL